MADRRAILVEVRNEFLGDHVFGEYPVADIETIPNVVARDLARLVATDGLERKAGMWLVSATFVAAPLAGEVADDGE